MSKYTDNPKTFTDVLNNFYFNLPKGWYRDIAEGRTEWMKKPCIDKTPEETYGKTPEFTDLFKKNTYRKFYDTIDTVLREFNLYDNTIRLQEQIKTGENKHQPQEQLYRMVLPVYRKLRQMGYSQHDLTS